MNVMGRFFQDYENEQNLKAMPTDKMLAEIAVKNILLQLSKRGQEKELYRELQKEFHAYTNLEDLEEIKELDVKDYTEELQFHKDIADKILRADIRYYIGLCYPIKFPLQFRVPLLWRKI